MNKTTIRSQLLQQRKRLSPNRIASISEKIVNHIIHSTPYQQAKHVALYLPFSGEVDLTALLQINNKHHYLPSIQDKQMQFQRHNAALPIKKHRYGISQPPFIQSHGPAPLDLCLMPLVGFDMLGNRLGMGGGFYDRYFANNSDVILAGVAHHFQCVSQLPTDDWDVTLQHIFTEQGHIKP